MEIDSSSTSSIPPLVAVILASSLKNLRYLKTRLSLAGSPSFTVNCISEARNSKPWTNAQL
jgi:hypothetical protein